MCSSSLSLQTRVLNQIGRKGSQFSLCSWLKNKRFSTLAIVRMSEFIKQKIFIKSSSMEERDYSLGR